MGAPPRGERFSGRPERPLADVYIAELFKQLGDDEQASYTLKSLSQLQLKRGQTIKAVTTMQLGLEGSSTLSIRDRFLRWLLKVPLRIQGL